MKYKDYLKSDAWKRKRDSNTKFWNNRCALCNGDDGLEVHHRTYNRIGRELTTDLITLCRSCHERHHKSIQEMRFEYRGLGDMDLMHDPDPEIPF